MEIDYIVVSLLMVTAKCYGQNTNKYLCNKSNSAECQRAEINAVTVQNVMKDREIYNLKGQLNAANQVNVGLQGQIQKNENVTLELQTVKNEKITLQGAVQTLQTEKQNQETEIQKLQNEKQDLQSEIQKLKDESKTTTSPGQASLEGKDCAFIQYLNSSSTTSSQMTCQPGQPCVSWYSPLSVRHSSANSCSNQGVLKVTPGTAGAVAIWLSLHNPYSFSFNVGDSSTNNGYGGDSSASGWEAEIHNEHHTLFMYEGGNQSPVPGEGVLGYFDSGYTVYSLNITKCNQIYMGRQPPTPSSGIHRWGHFMFNFDDIYIGLNRVIGGGRDGLGLCGVCVRFYPATC